MFTQLIREAAQHLQLSENTAGRLVRMLSDTLFDSSQGGIPGMRKRFADAGAGDLFASWIGVTPADDALRPDQFSAGFGEQNIQRITRALNLPDSVVNLAGAWLLPKIVGLVTRGGTIPTARPADYDSMFSLSAPVADVATPVAAATAAATHSPQPVSPARSGSGWWKWVLALLILAGAFLLYRGCDRTATPAVTTPGAPTEAVAPEPAAPTPAEKANPQFDFANSGGKITVSGRLPSDADKQTVMDALTTTFGAPNLSGDIQVNPDTLPAGWLSGLAAALPELKDDGLKFQFDGDRLNVDTAALPEERRFALSDLLRSQLGSFQISGLWDRAAAAFAGLKSGFSHDDLIKALNLMKVHFDTGSATITRDSLEILNSAANAIKQIPAEVKIEVGGHTDNTGNADANLTLSQQRADAVAAKLGELGVAPGVLVTKGYGQTQPVADNGTDAGKAENRRIEFSLVQ